MLDINFIRENPKKVKEGSKKKGSDIDVDKIIELDKNYREILQEVEELRSKRNELSKLLADKEKREKHLDEAEKLKKELKSKEEKLNKVEGELQKLLLSIPNMPFDDVPVGKDDSENVVARTEGKLPDFDFEPRDYMEIAEMHDLIDTERAAKISGTRFGYLKNEAAQLEFALVRMALDILIEEGFTPMVPPVLIRPEYMEKLGYLAEGGAEDIYHTQKDEMLLVGTSEQSLVPYFANEVLQEEELPKRFAAFSTCFRREAGSYGKDTRGILRVHQFDKVEMVSFTHPDKSRDEHKYLLSLQEKLTQMLELPYQVIDICSGDTGFPMAQKFDIEAWIPSENKYRETHSTSNATDFQARRLNTRYKTKDGQNTEFVHILNGTAYAIGRTIIALLENHQQADGSVKIPEALQKYTGFNKIG
ncbi:MAG: serine--tRNA ligase [Candidatus Spechtbacterales bacterium]|nr:serine--tRNA ligase [Candidatus Spechtbacterales bacterium]